MLIFKVLMILFSIRASNGLCMKQIENSPKVDVKSAINLTKRNDNQFKCMSDQCNVNLTIGQPLQWPTDCETYTLRSVCIFTIRISATLNSTTIDFKPTASFNYLIDLGVSEYLETERFYIISKEETQFTVAVTYFCSDENDLCEKNFLTQHFDNLTKQNDFHATGRRLSSLLLDSNPNVKECYENSNQLVPCGGGHCGYFNTLTDGKPRTIFNCLPVTTSSFIQLIHINHEIIRGPLELNESISFDCNKDKCNSLENVETALNILKNVNGALKKSSDRYSLYGLISMVMFVYWSY